SYPSQAGAATHPRPEQVDLSDVLERIDASDDQHVAQLRAAPYKALELRDRAGAALDAEQFELPRMPRPAARRLVLGSVRWLELTSPGPWRGARRGPGRDRRLPRGRGGSGTGGGRRPA